MPSKLYVGHVASAPYDILFGQIALTRHRILYPRHAIWSPDSMSCVSMVYKSVRKLSSLILIIMNLQFIKNVIFKYFNIRSPHPADANDPRSPVMGYQSHVQLDVRRWSVDWIYISVNNWQTPGTMGWSWNITLQALFRGRLWTL